jgi:hypothetical protein
MCDQELASDQVNVRLDAAEAVIESVEQGPGVEIVVVSMGSSKRAGRGGIGFSRRSAKTSRRQQEDRKSRGCCRSESRVRKPAGDHAKRPYSPA